MQQLIDLEMTLRNTVIAVITMALAGTPSIVGAADVVAPGCRREIAVHFHRQQQALRLGAFRRRHADAVKDFEVNKGNPGHLRFTIYDF